MEMQILHKLDELFAMQMAKHNSQGNASLMTGFLLPQLWAPSGYLLAIAKLFCKELGQKRRSLLSLSCWDWKWIFQKNLQIHEFILNWNFNICLKFFKQKFATTKQKLCASIAMVVISNSNSLSAEVSRTKAGFASVNTNSSFLFLSSLEEVKCEQNWRQRRVGVAVNYGASSHHPSRLNTKASSYILLPCAVARKTF